MKLYALPSPKQPVSAMQVKKRPVFAGNESNDELQERFSNSSYNYCNFKPEELNTIASNSYAVDPLLKQLDEYFQAFPKKKLSILPQVVKTLAKIVWLSQAREKQGETTTALNQAKYSDHYDAMKALKSDFETQQWWAGKYPGAGL